MPPPEAPRPREEPVKQIEVEPDVTGVLGEGQEDPLIEVTIAQLVTVAKERALREAEEETAEPELTKRREGQARLKEIHRELPLILQAKAENLGKALDLKSAQITNGLQLFEDNLETFRKMTECHVTLSRILDDVREEVLDQERHFHRTNRDLVVKARLLECVRDALKKFLSSVESGEYPKLRKEVNTLNAQEMDLPQGELVEPQSPRVYYLPTLMHSRIYQVSYERDSRRATTLVCSGRK